MVIRLGSGEYESTNKAEKTSSIVARHIFLEELLKQYPYFFNELGQFYAHKYFPTEIAKSMLEFEKTSNGYVSYFFISRYETKSSLESFSHILDGVPMFQFCLLVYALDEENTEVKLPSWDEIRDLSIKDIEDLLENLIPNWNYLKQKQVAHKFCSLIENWVEKNNLLADCFFEFILDIFRRFFSRLGFEIFPIIKNIKDGLVKEPSNYSFYLSMPNYYFRESVRKSILQLKQNTISFTDFDYDEIPQFNYKKNDFNIWLIWYPDTQFKKDFISKAKEKFSNHIEFLNQQKKQSFETEEELNEKVQRYKEWLENYCNHIEKCLKNADNEGDCIKGFSNYPPYIIWLPNEISRTNFIEQETQRFKDSQINIKKEIESLPKVTKADFEEKLSLYYLKVEKLIKKKKNWIKHNRKNSNENHFRWLVEYQFGGKKLQ